MSLYIDLTEFFHRPARTGIQRVCGELCRCWPQEIEIQPVILTQWGLLAKVPSEALSVLRSYFEASAGHAEQLVTQIHELRQAAQARTAAIRLGSSDRLLVPELFFDSSRLSWIESLTPAEFRSLFFIVYDLIPLTKPAYFVRPLHHETLGRYFRLIRNSSSIAFISEATRQDYYHQLCRRPPDGVVLQLGSDGLSSVRPRPSLREGTPQFLMVGTIEPRKNHEVVLDALEDLLIDPSPQFRLIFAGRMGSVEDRLAARIRCLSHGKSAFSYWENPDDPTLKKVLESSRALIFVSAAEGFGLPALESLWHGVPVVAGPGIPSLERIGETGVHQLNAVTPETVREAVQALLDPDYHHRKQQEAAGLLLPTWESFARETAYWFSGRSSSTPQPARTDPFLHMFSRRETMISYSQNQEDVLLARLFQNKKEGTYIDVGAMDPVIGSVTKYFYDLGWHGINIEPDKRFHHKLVADRPRDVNLDIAVGDHNGFAAFFIFPNPGLSTFDTEFLSFYEKLGLSCTETSVQIRTLTQLCDEHDIKTLDFLKIDAEGWEKRVLAGMDFQRLRPVVLVVESTKPFSHDSLAHLWEPILTEAGYEYVYSDGINRFYLRQEDAHLRQFFKYPPNALDNFVPAAVRDAEMAKQRLLAEIETLRLQVRELQKTTALSRSL